MMFEIELKTWEPKVDETETSKLTFGLKNSIIPTLFFSKLYKRS